MPDSIATSPSQLIKDAEARLRHALDSVGDGSWDWNIETGEAFYSDRWIESLGYSRSDAPVKSLMASVALDKSLC